MSSMLRSLPAVHEVITAPAIQALVKNYDHDMIVAMIRETLEQLRQQLRENQSGVKDITIDGIADDVASRLAISIKPKLRMVINATGVVLHTNLGRAPLAEEAARAAYEAGRGYLNLELDLESGKRSSRQETVRDWICRLLGCESGTVVNNNAAATVIALRALAKGQEVIVSRGQLVEIGGSFRIPEIMAVSGAKLKEVGTTNITRITDYSAAITDQTSALLRVHCSNYRIHGHTQSATLEEMVALSKQRKLLLIDDIGSGALIDFQRWSFEGEPLARASIAAGADLVLLSGDKLLGGPQAGIIAGRGDLVKMIEKDPLMRAFRCDKMTLAALEATLRIYLNKERAVNEIPILQMLETPLEALRQRAQRLAEQIRCLEGVTKVDAWKDKSLVGGGSLPEQQLETWVVAIQGHKLGDAELAYRLRVGVPSVVARVRDGWVLFDTRTIRPHQEPDLVAAICIATHEQAAGVVRHKVEHSVG